MPRGTRSHLRDLIQAEEMIVKLNKYCLSEEKDPTMDRTKIAAMKTLLNKCLPDIKAIELTGEDGKAIVTAIKVNFTDAPDDESE